MKYWQSKFNILLHEKIIPKDNLKFNLVYCIVSGLNGVYNELEKKGNNKKQINFS